MALQKPLIDPHTGDEYPQGYAKIVRVDQDTLGKVVNIKVNCYASQEARDAQRPPVTVYTYRVNDSYDPDNVPVQDVGIGGVVIGNYTTHFSPDVLNKKGKNSFDVGYDLIKVTPEWDGAVDIFEEGQKK